MTTTKNLAAAKSRIEAKQRAMYGTTRAILEREAGEIRADAFVPKDATAEVRDAFERQALSTAAFSQLSDAQEELAHGGPRKLEDARRTINRAKYLLDAARLPHGFGEPTTTEEG